MEHQDWTPVILRKQVRPADLKTKEALAQAQRTGKNVDTLVKDKTREERDRLRKLEVDVIQAAPGEDAPALAPLPTLNRQMQQAMIQARVARKYTQDTLAKAINEPIQVIKDLEGGKVVTKPSVVQKVNKLLGTTLKLGR